MIERQIIQRPCAPENFAHGRYGKRPFFVTIHRMLGSLAGTDEWFALGPDARHKAGGSSAPSSAHYGIGQTGEIHCYVKEEDTAYHAGNINDPTWPLIKQTFNAPNVYSVGIEHEGMSNTPVTDEMYAASGWLIAQISKKWGIALDRLHVVGHGEIYSGKRLTCPGPQLDIGRLLIEARAVLADVA